MPEPLGPIHDVLVEIFAEGLNQLNDKTLWRLRELLDEKGLQRSVALLEDLSAQKEPANRFKSFTKLLLAMRQLEVAQMQYPRLTAGGFLSVPGLRGFAIPQSYEGLTDMTKFRQFLERKRYRVAGQYLVSQKLQVNRLTLKELVPLLSNSFYRDTAVERLKELSDDRREVLAARLIAMKNRLLRRAGVSLLEGVGARVSSMKSLVGLLGDSAVQRQVINALHRFGSKATKALGMAFDNPNEKVRIEAVKLLRRIGDECADEPIKRFLNDSSETVRTWAKLALCSIGVYDLKFARAGAGEQENHLVRIFSKVELVRAGELDPKSIMDEIYGPGGWRVARYTAEALCDIEGADPVLEPTLNAFLTSSKLEVRRRSFEFLQHLPDEKYLWIFKRASEDWDPDISRKAIELVVKAEGFLALEQYVDMTAALTKTYKEFTPAEKAYSHERILPYLSEIADIRFVPYLSGLLRERCFSGVTIEYTYSLRPILTEFGEPLIPALRSLADDEILNIANPAREVLEEIGVKLD